MNKTKQGNRMRRWNDCESNIIDFCKRCGETGNQCDILCTCGCLDD